MQVTENPSQKSLNNKGKRLVYVGKMQPSGTASSRFQLRFPMVLSPCLFLHASFVFWPASLMLASYSMCFLSHIQGPREGLFSNHRSETPCFIPVGSWKCPSPSQSLRPPPSLIRKEDGCTMRLAWVLVRLGFNPSFATSSCVTWKKHFPSELSLFYPVFKVGVMILVSISLGLSEIMEQNTWHIVILILSMSTGNAQ